jgi:hypothetical protein
VRKLSENVVRADQFHGRRQPCRNGIFISLFHGITVRAPRCHYLLSISDTDDANVRYLPKVMSEISWFVERKSIPPTFRLAAKPSKFGSQNNSALSCNTFLGPALRKAVANC